MNLNISSGTASVLGLSHTKAKTDPSTAYIMLGQNCKNSCSFCTQALINPSKRDFLSRVNWNSFDGMDVLEKISSAYLESKLKRVCLQVVDTKESFGQTIETIHAIKKISPIPICTSSPVKTNADAKALFENGLDRLCIALDAASNSVYNQVKGYGFLDKINLLLILAKNFPHRITTHLIVGLGETEMDVAEMIALFCKTKIKVALFAFTPVPGTPMEKKTPPGMDRYRRIQIVHYLLQEKMIRGTNILHEGREIKGFTPCNNTPKFILEDLRNFIVSSKGKAFMTSGCPNCNRPYYNETPNQVPYNYPFVPSEADVKKAIEISGLF
jgi:lipoyl synthase